MKIDRETIKYEIGNFMISTKYYIANRRRRYFISWDTSKHKKRYIYIHEDWERDNQIWDWQFQDINEIVCRHKKKTIFHIMRYIQNNQNDLYIYIYENEDWERDKQIWDWQFHDINEILYRQKKKTTFHIMRYIQNSKNDIYIYKWRLREGQSNLRVAISWYQWYIISPKEEDDIPYHEIHSKQKKWYIFIYMKIETETIQYEIGNFKISMKYYVAKRRKRYFISWDTSKTAKPIYIYIYMKMKIERETNKYEIGNSMISMKYYIAKRKNRYFMSWDTSKTAKMIYIYTWMKFERETMKYESGSFMISMKYYIAKRSQRYFLSWDTPRKEKMIYIYIW